MERITTLFLFRSFPKLTNIRKYVKLSRFTKTYFSVLSNYPLITKNLCIIKLFLTIVKQNVLIISIVILLVLLAVGVYLLKSQPLENLNGSPLPQSLSSPTSYPEVTYIPQSTSSAESTASAENVEPVITTPKPNAKVKSPLEVKGNVPAGWMFEGVFPLKLLDADRNVIVQTQATETVPGSWIFGKGVEFSATLTFPTGEGTGFLVLEKDNPSGLPENADSFEIPIIF